MATLEQGWGFPYLAKNGHYFTENSMTSLCGKWMFTGARVDEFHQHDENCVACMREREKLAAAMPSQVAQLPQNNIQKTNYRIINMKHLMIDLETMGNKNNSPIVSIGAVFFEPTTGDLGAEFYRVISLESAMAHGAQPDASTIIWWLKQSSEARAAITIDDAIDINDALIDLCNFVTRRCEQPDWLQVWGNGASFDNVILRSAYDRSQITPPWKWFNDRDVRTIVELGRAIRFDPKKHMPFDGVQHNALADAVHQAKYVSAIWQRFIPPTSASADIV